MKAILGAAFLAAGVMGCYPHPEIQPAPAKPVAQVTVREVLGVQALIGRTVRVAGRCLPDHAPAVALGSGPIASQAWQLEDRGAATWVVGEVPATCGDNTVIVAQVAEDTLPKLSQARWRRTYLVAR